MKKSVSVFSLLSVVLLGSMIAAQLSPTGSGSSLVTKETGTTMAFSPDLQEALDVMKGLQSQVLEKGDQGAITPAELTALGAKVFQISDTFSHNDDRISVLTLDRSHFQTQVTNKLDSLFPTNNNIQAALDILKKPAAFINAYSDYQQQVPSLIASELGVSEDQLTSAVDEDFWTSAFEVTKDTREIIARMRGNDWLADYKQDLCVKTDSGVDMITFSKDNQGQISYTTTQTHTPVCEDGPTDAPDRVYSTAPVCEDNQLDTSWSTTLCEHGCDGSSGRCSPPEVKLSHFELCKANEVAVDNFVPGESSGYLEFDLGVIARNNDETIATDHTNDILLIVTGDNDAKYPEATDLKLREGKGYQFFPVALTRTESTFGQPVVISAKDSTDYINGSEAYADLKECPVIEDTVCADIYEPVCGKTNIACVQAPCPDEETFTNRCEAQRAGATDIRDGACGDLPKTVSCSTSSTQNSEDTQFELMVQLTGKVDLIDVFRNAYFEKGRTDFGFSMQPENYSVTIYPRVFVQDPEVGIEQCSSFEVPVHYEVSSCYDLENTTCEDDLKVEYQCESGYTGTMSVYVGCDSQGDLSAFDVLQSNSMEVGGCTDSSALNYNGAATYDDGSCEYGDEEVYGCTNPLAHNFDFGATIDDGSCEFHGCTDPDANNYDSNANTDDGSCTYDETVYGCTDVTANNYNPAANMDDGSCKYGPLKKIKFKLFPTMPKPDYEGWGPAKGDAEIGIFGGSISF